MITPLMHILSCIDDKYVVTSPVDIFYLNSEDRELIVSEANRLLSLFDDENKIWITKSDTGYDMVSDVQVVAGEAKSLNPYTALLLTRVWSCKDIYRKEVNTVSTEEAEEDLSTDAVVLRLEGNPRYVYSYVYMVMETPSLAYEAKIAKLAELLLTIQTHMAIKSDNTVNTRLGERLELHSRLNYWRGMLMADYMRCYDAVAPDFTEDTVEIIRKELADVGFYGFVNPLDMFRTFSASRVSRKTNVQIGEEVTTFLFKVVKSGGAMVG